MKKVAFVGSCLSASITDALLAQYPDSSLVAWLSHLRTDVFCDLFESGSKVRRLPQAELETLFLECGAKEKAGNNVRRADGQSLERIQRLKAALPGLDILIVDTNYDINQTVYDSLDDKSLSGLSLVPNKELVNKRLKPRRPPSADETVVSLQNMVAIVRGANPKTHITIVNFPASGFGEESHPERIRRTQSLNAALIDAKLDAQVIPALDIPKSDLSPKGPHYFSTTVYQAYAEAIYSASTKGEWPRLGMGAGIQELSAKTPARATVLELPKSARTPYDTFPPRNFWRQAVAEKYPLSVEGLYDKKFAIGTADAIATCGSCFAQHIGRRLRAEGLNVLDLEPAPAALPSAEHISRGYGIYSARYGNVYTARQLVQMFDQAFADTPLTEAWESNGRFYDPFRPNLDPEGFATPDEVAELRGEHLRQVRKMFEQLTLFVFTMGLTEAWRSKASGAVYPLCPGASVGRFDPALHEFVNFSYEETKADLVSFWEKLRKVNPRARMLLTVSPVPLTATAENRHVLVSTVQSKSILRAVAGSMATGNSDIDYFPSYEIITSPNFRGMFYAENLRSIRPEGVDFVMSHFFAQHAQGRSEDTGEKAGEDDGDLCDEILLDVARKEVNV
jgi:hypothetical protein